MMDESMKILVVDDERVVRDGCHRVLTGKGFDVLMAENGRQAMDILSDELVDVILLDLKMPVMSGEEVLEKTCDLYEEIPVIIITGHGTIDTAVGCMKKGAYDFITKPFQIDQFLLTINRAAEKRRLEQKLGGATKRGKAGNHGVQEFKGRRVFTQSEYQQQQKHDR